MLIQSLVNLVEVQEAFSPLPFSSECSLELGWGGITVYLCPCLGLVEVLSFEIVEDLKPTQAMNLHISSEITK